MTLSYWIGFKLGKPFFEKYGHRFHMGPDTINKTSDWFSKHGNKLLIVAYFIPGVRHITGYFSGITRLPFRTFALFAYSGSFLWVTVFITLGKTTRSTMGAISQFHYKIPYYWRYSSTVILILIFIYKKYKADAKEYSD